MICLVRPHRACGRDGAPAQTCWVKNKKSGSDMCRRPQTSYPRDFVEVGRPTKLPAYDFISPLENIGTKKIKSGLKENESDGRVRPAVTSRMTQEMMYFGHL